MNQTKMNIVAALKKMGYNQKQVSVKHPHYSSFDVTVRDPQVNIAAVEAAVSQFESIDRDERSGEILSGGNTFVFVNASPEVEMAWAAERKAAIEAAMASPEYAAGSGAPVGDGFHVQKGERFGGSVVVFFSNGKHYESVGETVNGATGAGIMIKRYEMEFKMKGLSAVVHREGMSMDEFEGMRERIKRGVFERMGDDGTCVMGEKMYYKGFKIAEGFVQGNMTNETFFFEFKAELVAKGFEEKGFSIDYGHMD